MPEFILESVFKAAAHRDDHVGTDWAFQPADGPDMMQKRFRGGARSAHSRGRGGMALTNSPKLTQRRRSADLAYPPVVGFRTRKAAQICAYFAWRAGESIEKLKLIKLVYLAERAAMAKLGRPMIFDELYSLPHGPVCSATVNGINGEGEPVWRAYITRHGNRVFHRIPMIREQMDEISNSEFTILASIYDEFKLETSSQLRNYTHRSCSEYTEVPEGKRLPIHYVDVFRAVGVEDAEAAAACVDEYRMLEAVLEHE